MATDTIQYGYQGYIYRCPHCERVDRAVKAGSWQCRMCQGEIDLVEQPRMNDALYSVLREINQLETGTVIGMDPLLIAESTVGRAAREAGVEIHFVPINH